jgi:hypothetical protein
MELAIEEHRKAIELGKDSGKKCSIPPITVYLHYHLGLAKLMESGSLDARKLQALTEENQEIIKTIRGLQ